MARVSSPSGDSDEEVPLRARLQRSGARRPFSWLREDSDEQVNMRPRHKRTRVRRFYEEETEEEEEESDEYGGEEVGEGSGEYGGGEEVGEEERDEYGGEEVGEEERYEYGGEEVGEEESNEYGEEVGREREEDRDFLNNIQGAWEEEEPNNEAQVHEQQQDGSQSHVSITLTDPELFDCPICCEPLTIPVYQCDQNGHIACSSCRTKINNKCPSCSGFIGFSRCRAMEKALESIKTSCQNITYGCKHSFPFHKKGEHINACVYSPCFCPHCNFVSPDIELYNHFRSSHATFATQFKYNCFFSVSLNAEASFLVLQEKNDDTLFILKKNYVEDVGNSVKVTCIQPGFRKGFLYQLRAKAKKMSLKLEALTESTPSRQAIDNPKTGFLLIPCDFISPGGQLKMEIRIESFEMYYQLNQIIRLENVKGMASDQYEAEVGGGDVRVHEQQDGSHSHVVITITDPELFDCPICYEPLTIPVYQCDQNGHIACSSCRTKINDKCPFCSGSIGFNHCRAIEKALESITISCQNIQYGCKESVTFNKKEKKGGTLFILKRHLVPDLGNAVTISCIQPGFMGGFFHELDAKSEENFLRLESFTKSTPSRQVIDDRPPKTGFLLIPFDFISSDGQLKMEICIWPEGASPFRRNHVA
ncbi:uncharacterized protein LOC117638536 [Prunus dulcis]|nr:uncharacterized protein LOC117638536 [Prunus dulcis]